MEEIESTGGITLVSQLVRIGEYGMDFSDMKLFYRIPYNDDAASSAGHVKDLNIRELESTGADIDEMHL